MTTLIITVQAWAIIGALAVASAIVFAVMYRNEKVSIFRKSIRIGDLATYRHPNGTKYRVRLLRRSSTIVMVMDIDSKKAYNTSIEFIYP